MSTQPGRDRRAFTLMELLLVLALMTIIASFAWPALDRGFNGYRLRKAADQVRTIWAHARVDAMRAGVVHQFHYEINASRALLMAVDELGQEIVASADGEFDTAQSTDLAASVQSRRLTLPEGIVFGQSEVIADARGDLLAGLVPSDGGAWSEPILFYPDGSTSTATLTLVNDDQRAIALELRGLTGTARVGTIFSAEEMQ